LGKCLEENKREGRKKKRGCCKVVKRSSTVNVIREQMSVRLIRFVWVQRRPWRRASICKTERRGKEEDRKGRERIISWISITLS